MDKYISELLTEMEFYFRDLASGNSYKDVGYDSKKEFFDEMVNKILELESRIQKGN
jgi:hypothetical protein